MPTINAQIIVKAGSIKKLLNSPVSIAHSQPSTLQQILSTELNELKNLVEQAQQSDANVAFGTIRAIVYDNLSAIVAHIPSRTRGFTKELEEHAAWAVDLVRSMTTERAATIFENNSNTYSDFCHRLQEIANISSGLGKLAVNNLLPSPTNNQSYAFMLKLMQQFLQLLNKRISKQLPPTSDEMHKINLSTCGLLLGLRDLLNHHYLSESDYPAILNEMTNLNSMVTPYGELTEEIKKIRFQIIAILNSALVPVIRVGIQPPIATIENYPQVRVGGNSPIASTAGLSDITRSPVATSQGIFSRPISPNQNLGSFTELPRGTLFDEPTTEIPVTPATRQARTPRPTFTFSHNPYGNSPANVYVNEVERSASRNVKKEALSSNLRRGAN